MSRTDLWNPPLAAVLAELGATPQGLAEAEAADRLRRFGPNDATARRTRPLWLRFLSRFVNPLVLILLFASALSAATGDVTSFAIVVVIVLSSVVLDFVQELRAEGAVDALRRSVGLRATVRRDGAERELPVEALVPGDVVRLVAGDLVPADARLLEARDLFVNQALLTGEPYPAEKHAGRPAGRRSPSRRRRPTPSSWAPRSSAAPRRALVCRTGGRDGAGRARRHAGLAAAAADAFEVGIRRFGLLILRLTVFLVLFVLAVNVLFHRPLARVAAVRAGAGGGAHAGAAADDRHRHALARAPGAWRRAG